MGTLYIVATPIGNLKDITFRAVEILQMVDVILCEDTRKTGMLLKRILPINTNPTQSYRSPSGTIRTQFMEQLSGAGTTDTTNIQINERTKRPELLSYYEENEWKRIPEVLTLLKNGCNVALVSDAGTPTISDPGFKLVRECIEQGFKVESIPGASAVISALVSSGLPTDKFLFIGFLPQKQGHRKTFLENVKLSLDLVKSTVIFFEAPHRLIKTFKELLEIFGDIEIVVARELTKIHEEIRREKINSSITHFEQISPKGEFVILFNIGKKV